MSRGGSRPERTSPRFHGLTVLSLACLAATCGDRKRSASDDPKVPPMPTLQKPANIPADLGERALRHMQTLVSFGVRTPGSVGIRRQLDYVAGQLEALGVPVRRDRFRDARENLEFENLYARLGGRPGDYILLGAHHDTKITEGHPDSSHNFHFVGANDGASGVALLLVLAEHFVQHPPPVTVELAFFDGEESIPYKWDMQRALFGSRRYVDQYRAERVKSPAAPRIGAMILFDMVAATDLQVDDDTNSDPTLKAITLAAAKACGHERYFFAQRHAVTDDHLPFRDAGIPVVDWIDLANNPQWHTPNDTLEHVSAASVQIVAETFLTALPLIVERFAPAPKPSNGDVVGPKGKG